MSMKYKGMHWLKCDLHMHTPEYSKEWHDADSKLSDPRLDHQEEKPEQDIQEKARIFLNRCHDLELDVIGITDHNFSAKINHRDWFLTHLVEQNKSVATKRERNPLVIFPGFEADIGYHVNCFLKPAQRQKDIEDVNTLLTKLGLPAQDRFGTFGPEKLRHNEQPLSLKKLLEIVQGEHGGIVIAAHADQNSGILNDTNHIRDYQHPDLYCVELTQNPPAIKYTDILSGKNRHWVRENGSPAWIMSSDSKSLQTHKNGSPQGNCIGYRYSWIKMSAPSIEALRQAFLDPESRIRLPEDISTDINPADRQQHSRILSVTVKNAEFLDDQQIVFSPNLNCLIGGRGCGKSTILEGMRLTLGKDNDAKIDPKTQEKIARARQQLTKKEETEITVQWRNQDGVEDTLRFLGAGGGGVTSITRTLLDQTTYLKNIPVQFYSQQQINQMTVTGDSKLLSMLNDFIQEPLSELEKKERDLCSEIKLLHQEQMKIVSLARDINGLSQEVEELDRQWQARASLQDEARKHQGAKAAKQYVDKLNRGVIADSERLIDNVTDIVEGHSPLGSLVERWPESEWFTYADEQWLAAKERLQKEILTAVDHYKQTTSQIFSDTKWPGLKQNLAEADQTFAAVCQEKGLSPEDVSRLQEISQKRQAKRLEKEHREKEKARLEKETAKLQGLFTELHNNWQQVYLLRKKISKDINKAASGEGKPVIELSVEYAADKKAFLSQWNKLYTNRRTRLGKNWEDCGKIFFNYFQQNKRPITEGKDETISTKGYISFWSMLEDWFGAGNIPDSVHTDIAELRLEFADIQQELLGDSRQNWQAAKMLRLPDLVDMILYRPDSSPAGKVSDNSLSDGQRNTAALAMLLAKGKGPLVFDQPEDELDSNFIYRELVPMMRRLKNERQIILATHNANLPVNGDAELIYALQTEGGRGKRYAEGGLDQASVTEAVLEIMEGSKDAFTKRREKYHF